MNVTQISSLHRPRHGSPKLIASRQQALIDWTTGFQLGSQKKRHTKSKGRKNRQSPIVDQECGFCSRLQKWMREIGDLTKPNGFADVIVRTSDGKKFYGYSYVLNAWSPDFLADNAAVDDEGKKRMYEIDIDDFSNVVVGEGLKMMHGWTMEATPLECLGEIMDMADAYKIPALKEACLKEASTAQVTPMNACFVWRFANAHQIAQLRQRSMKFVAEYLDDITTDLEGGLGWKDVTKRTEMLVDLFFVISELTTPKPPEPMRSRTTEMDAMWNGSNRLGKPYAHSDTTIVTKDDEEFHVQMQLMTAIAPELGHHLLEYGSRYPNGIVHIDGFDGQVMEEFLRLVYGQEPSAAFENIADDVYVLASEFDVRSVADLCEHQMAVKQLQSVERAVAIFQEAEEHRMWIVKSMCIRYFYEHADELRHCEEWKKLADENPHLITEIVVKWRSCRRMKQKE